MSSQFQSTVLSMAVWLDEKLAKLRLIALDTVLTDVHRETFTASCFHRDTVPKSIPRAPRQNIFTVGAKRSRCAMNCSIQPQRRRLFVMSQRNVCYIVFSSRHRAQIDCTSSQTEHFHCWRQTLPLRGELFHPAEHYRHQSYLSL